jgi:outer membrane protein TolC
MYDHGTSSPEALLASGCASLTEFVHNGFKVGPNYERPPASAWIDAANPRVKSAAADYIAWWTAFDDPVLNDPVRTAYAQNVNLLRVISGRWP